MVKKLPIYYMYNKQQNEVFVTLFLRQTFFSLEITYQVFIESSCPYISLLKITWYTKVSNNTLREIRGGAMEDKITNAPIFHLV